MAVGTGGQGEARTDTTQSLEIAERVSSDLIKRARVIEVWQKTMSQKCLRSVDRSGQVGKLGKQGTRLAWFRVLR